ncbi:MAG: hypothetical protein AAGE99_00655 [Chlamydiota bacterium]
MAPLFRLKKGAVKTSVLFLPQARFLVVTDLSFRYDPIFNHGITMFRTFLKLSCLLAIATDVFGAIRGAYHNRFAVEGDYVLLRRTRFDNKRLVSTAEKLLDSTQSHQPAIQSKDLIDDIGFDSGFSLALKIFQDVDATWEGCYLGGLSWQGKKTRTDPENLNLDGTIGHETRDYERASRVAALYDSDIESWQLNFWRHITPRYTDHFSVSSVVGFRMFEIDEKIKLYFHKADRTSHYRVETKNRSFGLQLGGDIEYNPYYFLTWGCVVKVGGMFNRDQQKTAIYDDDDTVKIDDSVRSGSHFSYMAEVYPSIELRPTKHFFFTVDYRLIYVGAVATAEQNVILDRSLDSEPILNRDGHVIYHGLTAGIRFNF